MPIIMTENHAQEILAALSKAKKAALTEMGMTAERYAKGNCPVRTGRLRGSITHQLRGDDAVVIGSNVEYAPYVELGTYKMSAQPYLRPAIEEHMDEYQAIVVKNLGGKA